MVERIGLTYAPESQRDQAFLELYLRTCIHLNDPNSNERLPKPYEFATITQQSINPQEVLPTATYVLQSNLDHLLSLEQQLLREGVDPNTLTGIIEIDHTHFMCPPILEVWPQAPFNNIPVIVDGAHRLFIAQLRGIRVNCIIISGYISYPLPMVPLSSWSDVTICSDVPRDKRIKNPSIPPSVSLKYLHRQQFPGSTGHRPCTSERMVD